MNIVAKIERARDGWPPMVKAGLRLSDRVFRCESCGVSLDRDLNAARNLGKLPVVSGEVTPVEIGALTRTRKRARETPVVEAGTSEATHLCVASG
jgi:putative transposase